ncbi:MAG TPA: 4-alpha-glucanotransferase [Steroidobacteraceae bacterium]|nr:4-alpha-glucanotransferase [Steroidobacteraceae bacterium]
MDPSLIERLARLRGIGDAYHDYRGDLRYFSLETKRELLRAMGSPVDDAAALESELRGAEAGRDRRFLPPLAVSRQPRVHLDINVSARDFGATLLWTVSREDGSRQDGTINTADCAEIWRGEIEGSWITRRCFELPFDLPPGYHRLEARISGGVSEQCLVIVSPRQCYEPPSIAAGAHFWGIAVQLYTLRSRANWGIGDFADLQTLIRWMAPHGAAFVGLNPLHALAPSDPRRGSPYSASSRHFLNVLYIAVTSVPEFEECAAARERLADPAVGARLASLRAAELVDYRGAAEVKLEFLQLLYRHFRERHLAADSGRGRGFREFVAAGGGLLQAHARFDALDHHFRTTRASASGWMSWPDEYHDVHGRAAARFAEAHPAEVEFHAYLQWIAQEQLIEAQSLARELGMPIGLYGDYAVGANPSGSETWADPKSYCLGAETGAPPDPLALKGQGWGIPPQDPATMRSQGLAGFARLIRGNMRYYGALRLDHVMALFRLWWVPARHASAEGAYVHYPLHELLTVLALESARAACLVVGEDLGVVPDEMRHAMPDFGLYHYKVLIFEKVGGRFRRPDEFAMRALATATTHDLPTLRSYWEGRDIELRRRLQLYPNAEIEGDIERERVRDREMMLAALAEQGLQPEHPRGAADPFTPELAHAMHLYLARSRTALVAVQIEDLLGMIDPVNVPGTHQEYPNWQRKVTADLEDLAVREDLAAQFRELTATRAAS